MSRSCPMSITLGLETSPTDLALRPEWRDFGTITADVDLRYTPGFPARLSGAPDTWAPGEGAEIEVVGWTIQEGPVEVGTPECEHLDGWIGQIIGNMDEDEILRRAS